VAARPRWAQARALRAHLLFSLAETSAAPTQVPQWRSEAREELSRALADNPLLVPEWSGPLATTSAKLGAP
jgi:hypothetical protein